MTRRERIINALNHRESDIVPYEAGLTQGAWDNVNAYFRGDGRRLFEGSHMAAFSYSGFPGELPDRPGWFRDDFGVVWNRSGLDRDIGVIENYVLPEPDIALWREPTLDEGRLRREIARAAGQKEDRFFFSGIGFSMFERAWSLCGMENLLMYMLTDPEFVHALLDRICAYNERVMDVAFEFDLDGFYFGDDWGQQKGLITGPALWRTFIKPRMARLYAKAKARGLYVLQHSCGDVLELFPDLIDIGLDCYQTFQSEIYDMEAVKRRFGGRLAFWGGISTQRLLPAGTPGEVRAETRRIMDIMRVGGGYIAAPTHALTADIPAENIEAMMDVFIHQEAAEEQQSNGF